MSFLGPAHWLEPNLHPSEYVSMDEYRGPDEPRTPPDLPVGLHEDAPSFEVREWYVDALRCSECGSGRLGPLLMEDDDRGTAWISWAFVEVKADGRTFCEDCTIEEENHA